MRHFANLFFLLFLSDAALSVADELLALLTGNHLLIFLRNPVASMVVLLTLPMCVILGIHKHPPKRLFVPLTLFSLWGAMAFFPLGFFLQPALLSPLASLAQLLFGLAGLFWLRKRSQHPFLLDASFFEGPWFSWKQSLVYSVIALFLLPLFATGTILASIPALVEIQTAGFMKVEPHGLVMVEKVYTKPGKTLRLVPMIHIGSSRFYDAVGTSMEKQGTLILAEGVTDKKGLFKEKFSYRGISKLLGLSSQHEMPLNATLIAKEQFGSLQPTASGTPEMVHADVDLSDFAPETVLFLKTLTQSFFTDKPFLQGYEEYNLWTQSQEKLDALFETVKKDLITRRNQTLFGVLDKALPHYTTLIIPWGALHMPDVEKRVQAMGFIQSQKKERLSVSFRDLAKALQSLSLQQNALNP
ncbi:MAG: hypothetical protein MI742_04960 [Desulfobacterales bacterium]|nr:hypothetical protein [Desulfobacterales bacterium]